jgi:uncharacterized FlaG/YvyC family protein
MNVTKVASVIPCTAIIPPLPEPGGVEGQGGGAANAPKSSQGKVATGEPPATELVILGAKHGSSLERASRERDVKEAVQKAKEALEGLGKTSLKLTYDHERHLVLMQVVKTAQKPGAQEEVIRQIPSEELLKLAKRLEESQGVLFDRQV